MMGGSKKEIIIAIFIGLTTGILFSQAVFYLVKRPASPIVKKEKSIKVSPAVPTYSERKVDHLVIDSPQNEVFTSIPRVTLSGKAPKDSSIFIISEATQENMELDNKENFSTEIELVEGENQIDVVAILKDGEEESKSLTIVYQKE